jgi:hypothetical protein
MKKYNIDRIFLNSLILAVINPIIVIFINISPSSFNWIHNMLKIAPLLVCLNIQFLLLTIICLIDYFCIYKGGNSI